ncbi:hypothetical protein [Methanosarcina acetivorans]|uniref:Uncharacterized protein n=1 Tax=Methanosarcina acetivorans (strain ATCC 35395 / DSM 2834 / JCM 12185 / C2A) TaxID=188937 RepID=Q8TPR0_METAC|nr:hypothetical protein [Methanosarcina acetivorans]AAM05251.1 predicted protein [Methanosarcina acetivorans C2A]
MQLVNARPLNFAEPAPALTGKLKSRLESDRMKTGLVFPSAWDRVLPENWKPVKSISAKNPKLLLKNQ